ncbi:MAG: cation:proton antiporter [archaeon]
MIELLAIGLIIVLGFLSSLFFEKTKIPDTLILMGAGILLGPVFGFMKATEGSTIAKFAPLVGTLALIIILFDGGLNLKILNVLGAFPLTAFFTLLVFSLTVAGVGFLMHVAFGWTLLGGILLGAIVGGTSSPIVISTIPKLNLDERVKIVLSLKSALTDAMCIITAMTVLKIIGSGEVSFGPTLKTFAAAFAVACVMGLIVAGLWMLLLRKMRGKPFGYMLTIATLFILYPLVEASGGSGAIAVLVFGLILGNIEYITKRLGMKTDLRLGENFKSFQSEVTFFVRTFFFVYLGLIFNIRSIGFGVLLMGSAILATIIAARGLATRVVGFVEKRLWANASAVVSMMPRGLAAAVLAYLPMENGISMPNLPELVFLTILATNVISTAGSFAFRGKRGKTSEKPEKRAFSA